MFASAEDVSPSAAAQRRSFYGQLGLESLLPPSESGRPCKTGVPFHARSYEGVL